MAIIFLKNLHTETTIGVFEWEKQIRQKVLIDLEMQTDISVAAISDDINDALDYKAISAQVKSFAENSRFSLIETLADKIADLLLVEFNIHHIKVTISKPAAVRHAKTVGIILEKSR